MAHGTNSRPTRTKIAQLMTRTKRDEGGKHLHKYAIPAWLLLLCYFLHSCKLT
jgi:hypothetical protein